MKYTRSLRHRAWQIESLESRVLLAGDLVAHWVAEDLAHELENGQEVTEWIDRIGKVSAKSGGNPTLTTDYLGGRAVVRFDSSDVKDWFELSAAENPLSNVTDFAVAVHFVSDSESLKGDTANWYDGTSIVHSNRLGFAADWGVALNGDGHASAGFGGGFGKPTTSVFGSTPLNDSVPHTIVVSRSAGSIALYVDGIPIATANGTETGAREPLKMEIGLSEDQAGMLDANIAEIRLYDGSLTDEEARQTFDDISAFYNNELPSAAEDFYTVDEDSLLFSSAAQGVLANDSDAEGDALTAILVDTPRHGDINFNADGSFLYDPAANFFGDDTFSYSAVDFRASEPTTVTITVDPKYDPPTGVPDEYKSVPGRILNIPALVGVLANDLNIDDAALTALVETSPEFGVLSLGEDGGFRFDPESSTGTTQFAYRIDDGTSLSSPTEVTLIVNSVPTANDDFFEVTEDEPLLVPAELGVVSNDADGESNALTAELISEPLHGTLSFSNDGSFAYEPNENYFGDDSFSYRVMDGVDYSAVANVRLVVGSVNDPPLAKDDAYFVSSGGTLQVDLGRSVLANDSDIEDATLKASLIQAPTNGVVEFREDGSFSYSPHEAFRGDDSFSYAAIDGDGAMTGATVKLFVGDAPIRINEIMAVNASTLSTRIRQEPDDRFRGDRLTPDWVELFNRTTTSIDISGFHLTDSESNLSAWAFPEGTTIPAEGFLVVFLDRGDILDTRLDESELLHTNFKLASTGEYLAITSPDGTVLDEVEGGFPIQVADVSYGLTENGFAYQVNPTPGAPNSETGITEIALPTVVSVPPGYHSGPLSVELTSETSPSTIRYTLDGSEPTDSNSIEYTGPISISRTTLLRTRVFADAMLPSASKTYSYIYLEDVLTQSDQPEGFPATWERAGRADYAIDPRVATDTESEYYDPNLLAALRTHDAISIVSDMDHLFDRVDGIYVNPQQQGIDWERPASMELISSDGAVQLQINAGLRIQGGASRNPNRPKHNMRFLFKEQYGESKLEYPFFADSPIQTIDTLILRGGNGDSWFHPNSTQQNQAQYIRDQWHKQTQQLMGHTFVPQRYIHLYVNGLYWGFYHTFEKPNASFFAERFGGQPEDYDVIQHQNGIVDGSRETWNNILDLARDSPELDATFEQLQEEIDIPAMMEYLLLNFYSGNVDWDQNNWFGGRKREDGKFIFFTWDAERTFLGARDNRTNAVNSGQPTDVHRRLANANEEYRIMFADMAHRHLFNGGLLTPESAAARWQALADEIELPLTAESARWGDNKRARRPYTAGAEWSRELGRLMNTYFPGRTDTLLNQLKSRDLYPDVVAPTFSQHGGIIEPGFTISMEAPEGIVYYTVDGTDPRRKGGDVSPAAKVYLEGITISADTEVRSRTLVDGVWSAMNEATFLTPASSASSSNLRVSEVNYNPGAASESEIAAGFDDNDDFEFIELLNVSDSPIDLADVKLVSTDNGGVEFDFSLSSTLRLPPGQRVLVVEDTHAFAFRYGDDLPVAGAWRGRLGNGGEEITVARGDEVIQQFTYDDEWYPSTDGEGSTLVAAQPNSEDLDLWSVSIGWQASEQLGGTPGFEASGRVPGDSNGDGVFNSADFVLVFRAGEYEDSIAGNSTFEEGDWNGDGDFDTNDFVFVFQAATYVAAVIPESVHPLRLIFDGDFNAQDKRDPRHRDHRAKFATETVDSLFLEYQN